MMEVNVFLEMRHDRAATRGTDSSRRHFGAPTLTCVSA